MTASPENAPITRRQARETQQTAGGTSESAAPSAGAVGGEAEAPRRRRASTSEPVAGGAIPAVNEQAEADAKWAAAPPVDPAASTPAASAPAAPATSPAAPAATGGLTRRQLRDLERTGSLERPPAALIAPPVEDVAPPVATPPRPPAAVVAPAPRPVAPIPQKPTEKPRAEKPRTPRPKAEQVVIPTPANPVAPRTPQPPVGMPTLVEQANGGRQADLAPAQPIDVSDRDDISEDPASTLSKGFGRDSMLVAALEAEKQAQLDRDVAFEDLLGNGMTSTGSVTTSSLIIPVAPSQAAAGATSNATGEVLITGSIELPRGLGASGQDPHHFDGADVDKLFESDEMPPSVTAASPVAASKAVSSHGSARDVVPATTNQSNKLLMALAIAAAVLAAGVLAVLVIGYFSGAF